VKAVLLGAGGHARSVLWAARSAGQLEVVACTDPNPDLAGGEIDGVPVVGNDSALDGLRKDGVEAALIGLGGTGDNSTREALYDRASELGMVMPPTVHASAEVAPSATLGDGSVVLAGAIVGPGVVVGNNVIVNTGALVDHDCELEAHAHVATGARLAGDVQVGVGAHVGIGATVLGGLTIGERAIVGAGATVIHPVETKTTVVGVPAQPQS
jgi:sugar O-acyltransferase (sialic acid O-acetyltransferase NeuD family)